MTQLGKIFPKENPKKRGKLRIPCNLILLYDTIRTKNEYKKKEVSFNAERIGDRI